MDDPDVPGRTAGGLFDSLRALITTLVAMARTRVELIGTEVEEEVRRVVTLLLWGACSCSRLRAWRWCSAAWW